MALSAAQFRKEYLHAAREYGVPAPTDAAITEDYEAYVYGNSLLLSASTVVRFFKDEAGKISWDVGPARA